WMTSAYGSTSFTSSPRRARSAARIDAESLPMTRVSYPSHPGPQPAAMALDRENAATNMPSEPCRCGQRRCRSEVPSGPGVPIGRDHRPRDTHEPRRVQRLPTRGGADVRDALTRTGVEDAHDEGRGMVLDGEPPFPEAGKGGGITAVEQDAVGVERRWPRVAAIVAQRQGQSADLDPGAVRTDAQSPALGERCGSLLGLVTDQEPELPHRPGREPGAQAHGLVVVALDRRRRVVRQPTE